MQRHVIVTGPDSPGMPFRPRLAVIAIPDRIHPDTIVKALVLSRRPFTLTNGTGGWRRWTGSAAARRFPQGHPRLHGPSSWARPWRRNGPGALAPGA
jgi:hypothetical protein